MSGEEAITPPSLIGSPPPAAYSTNIKDAVTGRFAVTVANPLLRGVEGPPLLGEKRYFVCPPASWNAPVMAAKFWSVSMRFRGVPSSFVNVTVTLAAGVPTAAGFVTVIIEPQVTLSPPSANCGRYKVVWAEQMPAAKKTKARVHRILFIRRFFIELLSFVGE
jgi:hypothetical protein